MSRGILSPNPYLNILDEQKVSFVWMQGALEQKKVMPPCLVESIANEDYMRETMLYDGNRWPIRYYRYGYKRAAINPQWRLTFPYAQIEDLKICQYLFDTQTQFYVKGITLWNCPTREQLRRVTSTIYEGSLGWWKSGTVRVYINGVEQTSGFTLYPNAGKVQWNIPPAAEDIVEAAYEREPRVLMTKLEWTIVRAHPANPRFDVSVSIWETLADTEVP
ncbi:MAG: hypothetical protein QXI19_04790 [Candidatus Caldarchaeum sp.]